MRKLGHKNYELTNHLGNVNAVITDVRIGTDDFEWDGTGWVAGADGVADYYRPTVVAAYDYYPFGWTMPGRTFNPSDYRFGHGTQEMVNEIKGVGNHYTAEFWEYDPRISKRWNTDPVVKPWESPYAVFHNNPVWFNDPNGDDPPTETKTHTIEKGQTLTEIAKQYETTVEDLTKWNNIEDPNKIYAGSELNVSDPNRWTSDGKGNWMDSQAPGELWTGSADEGWTDLNSISFGEWFSDEWQKPVGSINSAGEQIIGKYDPNADMMMQVTPLMIQWGITVWRNPRLASSNVSGGYKYQASYKGNGNFGHLGSYRGTQFNFKTSHGFYRAHGSGSFANTRLTANQVESAIAKHAQQNLNKIPQLSGKGTVPFTGSINVGGTKVGYQAVMRKGVVEVNTYWPY